MSQFTLILDNTRSNYNVGAILRTCDAAGISTIFACGTTPYPAQKDDKRDPVVVNRNTREIAKTALGAEATVTIEYRNSTEEAIAELKARGWHIYALEQTAKSHNLFEFRAQFPTALLLGNETVGISAAVLKLCEAVVEIPQQGTKESLNVSVSAGIAVYQFRRQMADWRQPGD
ncbi:MAG TPA: TrmH family RNA methyltransferase [Candidatus Saccharimonadales bacterium]|nr:TrmH family RNA methyltransferase [Candidatus Saccharimonadales bacterium]